MPLFLEKPISICTIRNWWKKVRFFSCTHKHKPLFYAKKSKWQTNKFQTLKSFQSDSMCWYFDVICRRERKKSFAQTDKWRIRCSLNLQLKCETPTKFQMKEQKVNNLFACVKMNIENPHFNFHSHLIVDYFRPLFLFVFIFMAIMRTILFVCEFP